MAMLLRERREPGLEVPTPRLPVEVMRSASVKVPAFRVEKAKSPFPPLKFCWRIEVMEAVEVAPKRSFSRKLMRALVVVPLWRFAT